MKSGKCTYKGSCLSIRHSHLHIDQCKILSPFWANLHTMARPVHMPPKQFTILTLLLLTTQTSLAQSIIYFTSSGKFFIMIHLSSSSFASLFSVKNLAANFFASSRIFSPGNIT